MPLVCTSMSLRFLLPRPIAYGKYLTKPCLHTLAIELHSTRITHFGTVFDYNHLCRDYADEVPK